MMTLHTEDIRAILGAGPTVEEHLESVLELIQSAHSTPMIYQKIEDTLAAVDTLRAAVVGVVEAQREVLANQSALLELIEARTGDATLLETVGRRGN